MKEIKKNGSVLYDWKTLVAMITTSNYIGCSDSDSDFARRGSRFWTLIAIYFSFLILNWMGPIVVLSFFYISPWVGLYCSKWKRFAYWSMLGLVSIVHLVRHCQGGLSCKCLINSSIINVKSKRFNMDL